MPDFWTNACCPSDFATLTDHNSALGCAAVTAPAPSATSTVPI
jgi:hypothetical protein